MEEDKTQSTISTPSPIKKYTPEELQQRKRAEREANERRAKEIKKKYLEFYDDIKQPEDPSW